MRAVETAFAHNSWMHRSTHSHIRVLTPEALTDQLSAGGVVLDIRAPQQFVDGHIPGSICLPLCRRWAEWCAALLPLDRSLMIVADAEAEIGAACDLARCVGELSFAGRLGAGDSPGTPMDAWICSGGAIDEMPTMRIRAIRDRLLTTQAGGAAAPTILDVRDDRERAMLGCTITTPVALGTLPGTIDDFPRDQPTLTLCRSGVRSVIAASVLRRYGFADVMPIELGIDRWCAEYPGDPWWVTKAR